VKAAYATGSAADPRPTVDRMDITGSSVVSGPGPRPHAGTPSPDRTTNVWPLTAEPPYAVGGVPLTEIAERFGTPAYVLDEEHVRQRCRDYREALHPHRVAYAGQAFLSRAVARWIREEGLGLDVCSSGEPAVALAAGFPPERIRLHGDGKTRRT
jgi:diaminopimelate decarboxylase